MQFVKDLHDQLAKAVGQAPPWGDVNPLVVIGLTEAILDLGLTEDQMYPVVRSFLRQLAAQVHPDRNPTNVSALRQQQILAALNYLDDRVNFSRALDHFRTLKAEDRHEIKLMHQTVSALRKQSIDVEKREIGVRLEKEGLLAKQIAFRKLQQDEPLRVPGLEHAIQELTRGLKRAEETSRTEQRLHQLWLRRYGKIARFIENLGSAPWPGPPFHPFVFDAKWAVVLFLSFRRFQYKERARSKREKEERARKQSKRINAVRAWTPTTTGGKTRKNFLEVLKAVGVPEERVPEVMSSWKEALQRLQRSDEDRKGLLVPTVAVFSLSGGYPKLLFGDPQAALGRIIGSMSPHEGSLVRKDFKPQSRERIIETTIPFLISGRLLVSASKDDRKGSRAPLKTLYDSSFFYAKREILATG